MGSELIVGSINNLLPSITSGATQAAANAITPILTKATTDVVAPTATRGLQNLLGSTIPKVQPSLSNFSDDITNSYNKILDFKNTRGMDYDILNDRDFDYAALTGAHRKALANAVGEDALKASEQGLSGMLKMAIPEEDYINARGVARNFIASDASTPVVEQSRRMIAPGTKIYRANNSPEGISWTTDKAVAERAVNDTLPWVKEAKRAGLPSVLEYTLQPNDRYIAPQFTEYINENPLAQSEVLFDFNAGEPSVQQSLGYGGTGSFSNDIMRVGSAEVAPIDKETLPVGWDKLEQYLSSAKDRVPNAIGKPRSKITKSDLAAFNADYGYDTEGTKDELWRAAQDAIDDQILDDLYMEGSSAADIIATRKGRSDLGRVEDLYLGAKGRTGRLDAELSDRLGIGRSNTPMLDRLNKPSGGAMGDYGAGAIGSDPLWATGEYGVNTVGHERLHAFQEHAALRDYDPAVSDAFYDLEDELIPLLHNESEIKAAHPTGDVKYWGSRSEQEARMFQDYLEYKNYTQKHFGGKRKYEYGEEIIKPFDKFIKKLQELSKKGIALPALGLLFGGATVAAGAGANRES